MSGKMSGHKIYSKCLGETELIRFCGYQLFLAKNHKYTQAVIDRFPDFQTETEKGFLYPIFYLRGDELKEICSNIVSPKGRHPAQDALMELKVAQYRWDSHCEMSGEKSLSQADYYFPNALENLREAERKFKEACKFKFVRDENFKWVLIPKI